MNTITWILLVAALFAGAVGIGLIVASFSPTLRVQALRQFAPYELYLAAFCSISTVLGSMYFSEFRQWTPCRFCWYQRIAAYPIAMLLIVAIVRRDTKVWPYVLSLALPGALLSLYHLGIQNLDFMAESTSCDAGSSCAGKFINEFGIVSIPFMALCTFIFLIGVALVVMSNQRAQRSASENL